MTDYANRADQQKRVVNREIKMDEYDFADRNGNRPYWESGWGGQVVNDSPDGTCWDCKFDMLKKSFCHPQKYNRQGCGYYEKESEPTNRNE